MTWEEIIFKAVDPSLLHVFGFQSVCVGGRGEHRMDPSRTDRRAGLRERVAITKSVCYFSTADSAMDLSIRSTAGLLIFQSRGRGPSIFTCSNFSKIIKDQCVRPTHIQLTKPRSPLAQGWRPTSYSLPSVYMYLHILTCLDGRKSATCWVKTSTIQHY